MQEKNRNFANIAKSNGTLLVYKDQEAGSRVFCGVVSCTNVHDNIEKLLLKLKRRAKKEFNKGMKWADERFNTKPNRLLNSYFYSVNLDKDKEYFTSMGLIRFCLPATSRRSPFIATCVIL